MTTTVQVTTVPDDGKPAFVNGLTVGDVAQKHVLRTFNPSGDQRVDLTKVLCASLVQQMIDLREDPKATAGQKRGASIAITLIEGA